MRKARIALEGTADVEVTDSLRESAHALLDKASDWQERIRHRAQAIWEREGRPEGRHEDHWREAEKELAAEPPATTAAGKKPSVKKPRKAQAGAKPARTTAARAKDSVPWSIRTSKEASESTDARQARSATPSAGRFFVALRAWRASVLSETSFDVAASARGADSFARADAVRAASSLPSLSLACSRTFSARRGW